MIWEINWNSTANIKFREWSSLPFVLITGMSYDPLISNDHLESSDNFIKIHLFFVESISNFYLGYPN